MYFGAAVEFWNARRVSCLTEPFISHFIYVIPLVEIFHKLLNSLVWDSRRGVGRLSLSIKVL